MSQGRLLWTPSPESSTRSQMHAFLARVAQRHGVAVEWEALRAWSLAQSGDFWAELVEFFGVEFSTPPRAAREGDGMLGTRWFPGATLNYARHLLRRDGAEPAILFADERGRREQLSWRDLRTAVARCAAGLREAGIQRGDRVAGLMPNVPETVIAMLATASLGAIWSSCSPDFGARGVIDRFGQIEPKVLFCVDGYTYAEKPIEIVSRLREMQPQLQSLKRLVVVPYLDRGCGDCGLPDAMPWSRFLRSDAPAPALEFAEVPFDHPLFIMYSSGTTGVPKCIVHGHGGTLLQHLKELGLHTDLRPGEKLFYFTTCGWMMWNWLVSGLACGAAIVLFEGNPGHPDMNALWRLAAELHIDVFGASAKYLAACEKAAIQPGRDFHLGRLRCICSTGSPLAAELFEWTYANVKSDLQLSSICGGTDIISCFILGNPLLPVFAGEIQCRGLGMDVHAWDEQGRSLVGEKGELVCTSPFPSQPVGFWNDPDGRKYRSAYFDAFAGPPVWRHGDFIEITPCGGVVVFGRSDATLNPGGVRIGTAEIYRVVEGVPEVADSLVVGRDTADQDVEVCLFVVLRPGLKLDAALEKRIRDAIASQASKRHVPKHVRQVDAIPYTISGKKVELAVRRILHGQDVPNRDALANPQALEQYRGIL